jgi:hypothetical protein
MIHKEVAAEQKEILTSIYDCSMEEKKEESKGFLRRILDFNELTVDLALGALGTRLRAFAIEVDFNHPDLLRIYDGQLSDDSEFASDATDLLRVYRFKEEWDLSDQVVSNLKRVFAKKSYYKTLNQSLDPPSINLSHVRFIASEGERLEIRRQKRIQPLNLSRTLYSNAKLLREGPADFSSYLRNSSDHIKEAKELEDRMAKLNNFGLTSIGNKVHESKRETLRQYKEDVYYGFIRVSLTSVAAILAKIVGYQLHESRAMTYFYATPDSFSGYEFCVEMGELNEPEHMEYDPFFVPVHRLTKSKEMKRLLKFLDKYPATGGRPLFDHLWVVVPGIRYPIRSANGEFSFRRPIGDVATFDNFHRANLEFHEILLDKGYIASVLVGERDGKMFFISYWR